MVPIGSLPTTTRSTPPGSYCRGRRLYTCRNFQQVSRLEPLNRTRCRSCRQQIVDVTPPRAWLGDICTCRKSSAASITSLALYHCAVQSMEARNSPRWTVSKTIIEPSTRAGCLLLRGARVRVQIKEEMRMAASPAPRYRPWSRTRPETIQSMR